MRSDVPPAASALGFVNEPVGTHTSRTIMLTELRGLLSVAGGDETYEHYQAAAVDMNAVRKATHATRQKTFRHLRELYSLSPEVPVFAALRTVWQVDPDAQPLIAAMCAVARDPLLRCTVDRAVDVPAGEEVTSTIFAAEVIASFPGHYSADVTARIGRNLASSWTQAGLLSGRARKTRVPAPAHVPSVTYGLFLGYLCGERGDRLFATPWARMLDHAESELRTLASVASRQGWLEYRETGGVTEITFRRLDTAVQNGAA